MKKGYVLVLFALTLSVLLNAQRRSRYKYELVGGVGSTSFLGDLGGADQVGTHGPKDWEWSSSRPLLNGGFRYKNSRWVGFKGGLSAGVLSGNDKWTNEPIRNNRNLSFRSYVFELAFQVEGYVNKEQQGHLYRIKNAKGAKKLDLQFYGFAGAGVTAFITQGNYKGKWVNLRPLSTEGQGLPGGPKKYAPVTMVFPMGLGFKYGLDRQWSIGLEGGLRYTLTDYIDDVSGVYYDNATIRALKGDVAAYMADPQLGRIPSQSYTGEMRGRGNYTDAYIFGMVTVNYKIRNYKRTRSKF